MTDYKALDILLVLISLLIVLVYSGTARASNILFHIKQLLLVGKKILKVTRDFKDPFVWVLAEHNQISRFNSITIELTDHTKRRKPDLDPEVASINTVKQDLSKANAEK